MNCLNFGEQRWERRSERCRLCGQEGEDLVHFMLICGRLDGLRRQSLQLQRPWVERMEDQVGQFLFDEQLQVQKRQLLNEMWKRRGRILRGTIN